MSFFKKTQTTEESRRRIRDWTKEHLQILLFRSREHHNLWCQPFKERKIVAETGEIVLPTREPWGSLCKRFDKFAGGVYRPNPETLELMTLEPEVVHLFGFQEEDMIRIWQQYQLFDWERREGRCPLCRIHPGASMMRTTESWFPCVHLQYGEEE